MYAKNLLTRTRNYCYIVSVSRNKLHILELMLEKIDGLMKWNRSPTSSANGNLSNEDKYSSKSEQIIVSCTSQFVSHYSPSFIVNESEEEDKQMQKYCSYLHVNTHNNNKNPA